MSPLKRLRSRTPADASARSPQAAATRPSAAAPPQAGDAGPPGRRPFRLGHTLPVLLLQAAHPKQAVLTALGVATTAAVAGRPAREAALVFVTVLVGQAILGWDNDLVDRVRDKRHDLPGKPIAHGLLEPGTAWFTLTCALLLVVPLSLSSGPRAGGAYLVALLIALTGNRFLRGSALSFLPWVLSFGLYPAFIAYGGWNGTPSDTPPTVTMTVLAALLGLGVHVLRALPGLVPDNIDSLRSLPLRLALKTGAPRLLLIAAVFTGVVGVALLISARALGLD
ncbi:UbiA family prenyltransferase [Nocardioides sp.]|uniref:UbiA family prenyltransferase n=1 Tax=Nocardioides sp. TaxID=35761 RepID=UPI002C7A0047|nr:UbiA family prenyltransferase [Nocardioides sp.]HXH79164.1 UbiA family prenyltransferase [Nocardioides sp.]